MSLRETSKNGNDHVVGAPIHEANTVDIETNLRNGDLNNWQKLPIGLLIGR